MSMICNQRFGRVLRAQCVVQVVPYITTLTRRHRDPVHMTAAQHAVYAARNRLNWGRNAARLYCDHHQVPATLYRLACQLQATQAVVDLMPAHLKRQAY